MLGASSELASVVEFGCYITRTTSSGANGLEREFPYTVFTSPAGVVAKYCDEHVCLCVCLSVCLSVRQDIPPESHARSLSIIFLCMLPMAVALSSSDRVTKSQGKKQFWLVFFPIDNALQRFRCKRDHSIAIANDVVQQKGSVRRCRVRCK